MPTSKKTGLSCRVILISCAPPTDMATVKAQQSSHLIQTNYYDSTSNNINNIMFPLYNNNTNNNNSPNNHHANSGGHHSQHGFGLISVGIPGPSHPHSNTVVPLSSSSSSSLSSQTNHNHSSHSNHSSSTMAISNQMTLYSNNNNTSNNVTTTTSSSSKANAINLHQWTNGNYDRFLKQSQTLQGSNWYNFSQNKKNKSVMNEWEQLLEMYSVIHVTYNEEDSKLHMLLDNGTMCHFSIHSLTSDVEVVNLDRLSLNNNNNNNNNNSNRRNNHPFMMPSSGVLNNGSGGGGGINGGLNNLLNSGGVNSGGMMGGGVSGGNSQGNGSYLACGMILPQNYRKEHSSSVSNTAHHHHHQNEHCCVLAQQNDINFYFMSVNSHASTYGTMSSSSTAHTSSLSSCTFNDLSIETLLYMNPVEMKTNHNNSLLCVKYHNGTLIVLSLNDQRIAPVACIYRCPISPKNQQEHIQWSRSQNAVDIMYFAFSNKKPYTLITLEVVGMTNVYWNVYERVMSRDFQKIQAHKIRATSPVTCCAMSPSETHICIGCADGTILLWASDSTITSVAKSYQTNKLRLTIQKIQGKQNPFMIRWHSSGGLLLVGFNTENSTKQEFHMLDLGLNILSLYLSNGMMTNVLHSQNLIGKRKRIKNVTFLDSQNMMTEHQDSSFETLSLSQFAKAVSHQLVSFVFEQGPIVLVRIDLTLCHSMYDIKPLSSIHLLTMHIHNNCMEESRTLIRNISNPSELYCALCIFVNYLLRQVDVDFNGVRARAYLDIILDKYANLFKETSHSMLDAYSQDNTSRLSQLHNLYRRYFIYTLRHGYYEKAFQIAATLSDEDMFQQIYHATRESQYYEMSYLSFMKSSEPFKKHMRRLKQLVKQGSQTISDETGVDHSKQMEPIEDLVARYLSASVSDWSAQETERLGVYFEMEGDLDNAVKCFTLSTETREQRSRISSMRETLYDYQTSITENVQ